MIINKYGITLSRLRIDEIEQVRAYRNSEAIRSRMFYQEHITAEQQLEWFHKINNHFHHYMMVNHVDLGQVGLVHGIINSFEEGRAEGGIFFWNEGAMSTLIPPCVSLCMNELTFELLDMNVVEAEVREDNKQAVQYNLQMGFKVVDHIEEEGRLRMELVKSDYRHRIQTIKQYIAKQTGSSPDLSWSDVSITQTMYDDIYSHLPNPLRDHFQARVVDEALLTEEVHE